MFGHSSGPSRDFELTGSRQLAELAKRLSEAGDAKFASGSASLRNQLIRRLRAEAQKAIPEVKKSATDTLPGKLGVLVSQQDYRVHASLAAVDAHVRVVGNGTVDLKGIEGGSVRHPVFNDPGQWVNQDVNPGFFSTPLKARKPEFLRSAEEAMNDVARQITRRF